MTRTDAIQILQDIRAKVNQDYHSLTRDQALALQEHADRVKYRTPVNATGSRSRCFYAFVSRRARQPS